MVDIEYREDEKRVVALDGDEVIGFASYSDSGSFWIADSTVVNDSHQGQGIAGHLVDQMVLVARDKGVKILPLCPYVKARFEKNHDVYDDIRKK